MNGFSPATLPVSRPDPSKHVNYALGMVLGVDDLDQEFAYGAGRDQWIVRDLLGYGTAWGLAVTTGVNTATHQEVRVAAGVGVDPRGQLIRVAPAQCADLHDWLATRTSELSAWIAGGVLELYLVLRYRDCLTDLVPIAGEPCRTADESMAPSRVTDGFALELRFAPPGQPEEDSIVDVVAWLRSHLAVSDAPSAELAAVLDALRAAVLDTSPLTDYLDDAAPPLAVNRADLGAYLRAILGLWVTELRPRWVAGDDALLLAKLTVPVTQELGGTTWDVASAPPIAIDETHRPYLLQLRFLQEWLLASSGGRAGVETPPGARVAIAAAGVLPCAGADGATPTPPARAQLNNLRISQAIAPTADNRASLVTLVFDPPPIASPDAQMVVTATLDPGASTDPEQLTLFVAGPVAGNSVALRLSRNGAALSTAELQPLAIHVQILELGS